DSFRNRRYRTYGLAWTTDRKIATRHALAGKHRMTPGGSVLLKSYVPNSAIITTSHFVGDYYGEEEYVVDRRRLKKVEVLKHFSEIQLPPFSIGSPAH